MTIFSRLENFLKFFCSTSSPVLLALSGGSDSLCLFFCLLMYREKYSLPFHIAHIDHGWRPESAEEARILQQLALDYQVPFHLKTLDPKTMKGNLEAACREERYDFFAALCQQIDFQGVMTGHHQDDQAETIFKRILEGAHWSRWIGLKPESWKSGVRILRPLMGVTKREIQQFLSQRNQHPFEDPTNHQLHYLRARFRETIFPRLNREFGKQVEMSFINIGKDAQELACYFEERLVPLTHSLKEGPWGFYLNLQNTLPESLLEIKYLTRLLCTRQQFFLSREITEQVARALHSGQANRLFVMGSRQVWVDRKRLFILHFPAAKENASREIGWGSSILGQWKVVLTEDIYTSTHLMTSWEEGWQGYLCGYLPIDDYLVGFAHETVDLATDLKAVKKRWSQAKIPAFLSTYCPFVYQKTRICHEFLTGKTLIPLEEGMRCWKIELFHCSQKITKS